MQKQQAAGFFTLLLATAAVIGAARLLPSGQSDIAEETAYQELLENTPMAELTGEHISSYSLSDMETKAQGIMDDETLRSYQLYSDSEKAISFYIQNEEIYGTSNSMCFVIYHSDNRDVLLQDASLSIPEYVIFDDDFIYICGRTTAFSTIEGINITRYRCTEDCVVIENAVEEKTLRDRYYIYQDEYNESLVSIIPIAQDGMGRIYFDKIEGTTITATEIEGLAESKVVFRENSGGKFVLDKSTGTG